MENAKRAPETPTLAYEELVMSVKNVYSPSSTFQEYSGSGSMVSLGPEFSPL